MTGQYIVQAIFALAGITSLLASLLNWNWFFTTRNAQTIVRNVGRGRARLFYGILALILTGFFYLFIRPIVSIAFDREFARSQKIPVEVFEYVLMMFIALTIVACLRMVGIVLAISLLTIPQMTANLFTYSFKKIIWLSIGIGFLGCLGGLFISYHWKVPSGASIIFFSILIYAVCKIGKSCCKKQS